MQPNACAGTLNEALTAAHANTSLCFARAEYPDCGLTALYSVFQIHGAWGMTTFDRTTDQLVGVDQQSDTNSFGCPGQGPASFSRRAGRLPTCQAATCETFGNCGITVPPPCAR